MRDALAVHGADAAAARHQPTGRLGCGRTLADLLTAVERFESAVIKRGGDLMVNMPGTADPQDPAFVLPQRSADESVEGYTRHINEAAAMLEVPRSV